MVSSATLKGHLLEFGHFHALSVVARIVVDAAEVDLRISCLWGLVRTITDPIVLAAGMVGINGYGTLFP